MDTCVTDINTQNKSEQIRRAILDRIADDLKHHIFSEENSPESVVIQTTYNECVQVLRISFKEIED